MRIISGSRRGHKLYEFGGDNIRPTTDRVKEAVFSMIGGYIADAVVLDMFAGSGALSFEMISRGAKHAVLIDADKHSVEVIEKNMRSLGFEAQCEIYQCSCLDYVKRCGREFDVIFMDPPYNGGFIEQALRTVVTNSVLAKTGIIVLESDSTDFKGSFSGLDMIKQKKYGRTYITIYRRGKIDYENSSISGQL